MIITDTFSNLFSSIKNGCLANKSKITQLNSKQNQLFLNILIREGFIKSYKIKEYNKIDIFLKYKKNISVITDIKRISKPSKRFYLKNKDLYKKKRGIYIISTSKGFLTDFQAKKFNIGGEFICKII